MTFFAVFEGGAAGGGLCVPTFRPKPVQPQVVPGPGGQFRDFADKAQFDAAKVLAVPGDVLRQTQSLAGPLDYRGNLVSGGSEDAGWGAPGNHVWITAVPGAVLDGGPSGGNFVGALDVRGVRHVNVVGMRTTGGTFGIRLNSVQGTQGSPCLVGWNEISHTGWAHLPVQAWWTSPYVISEWVEVIANNIHDIAADTPGSELCEGVYLGKGDVNWADFSQNIRIAYNDIWNLESDGVDVKGGITNYQIEYNNIWNITHPGPVGPLAGITASFQISSAGAIPGTLATAAGVIRGNRIWNITGMRPIVVGFGGIDVLSNLCWDYPAGMAGVRIVSELGFSGTGVVTPNLIQCNTFGEAGWRDAGWSGPNPSPVPIITSGGNIYDGNDSGEYIHDGTLTDFVGPITGAADSGHGEGSGFMLQTGSGANNTGSCEGLMLECV